MLSTLCIHGISTSCWPCVGCEVAEQNSSDCRQTQRRRAETAEEELRNYRQEHEQMRTEMTARGVEQHDMLTQQRQQSQDLHKQNEQLCEQNQSLQRQVADLQATKEDEASPLMSYVLAPCAPQRLPCKNLPVSTSWTCC